MAAAKHLPLLLLVLASKSGWQETQILRMPLRRMLRYVNVIKPGK